MHGRLHDILFVVIKNTTMYPHERSKRSRKTVPQWYEEDLQLILKHIAIERSTALTKHGIQDKSADRWMSIITKELGEAAKELNDADLDRDNVYKQEYYRRYRQELLQVAASCVGAIINLDHRELRPTSTNGRTI